MQIRPAATIPDTEVQILQSSFAPQEYQISVALPFHYHERAEKIYPVIYVLDANLFFGMAVEMVRAMNVRVPFCNELPDALVVGIGYPVNGTLAQSHAEVMHLRMRDFTPRRDEDAETFIQEMFPVAKRVASGGAQQFLQFIQRELVPLVEAEYRVDANDRTLLGHSWGGLFALYALFQQPQLFQRYVVVSPDMAFGNGMLLDDEKRFADEHNNLAAHLYLANADADLSDYQLPFFKPFMRNLSSRDYADFKLTQQIIPNCTHCAVVAPAFQAGLRAVFG